MQTMTRGQRSLRRHWLVMLLILAGCGAEQQTNTATQKEMADLILVNGKVLVVDPLFSIQEVLVVRDGRVLAVGDASITDQYSAARVVDLGGKVLMPGFNDSHTHIEGNARRYIDLNKVESIQNLQRLIQEKIDLLGEGEWITGYGWSEDELVEKRRPLRADLDAVAPNNPVVLTRAGGHSAVANSLALALAQIDESTPQPEGGVIEKDDAGALNGIIRERQELVERLVPQATYEELIASLEVNLNRQLSLGITSLTDAMKTPEDYPMFEDLYANAELALPRAALQFQWHDPAAIKALKARVGDGSSMLKIGPIKVFADGGFTGPAAYTLEPYANQDSYRGYLNMPRADLVSLLNEVHDAGWQMGIHAIGDAAIVLVVDTLAGALERNPRGDHRHYLNHFSMRPPEDTMVTMAAQGIHITQQPNFTYTLEGRYVENLDGWRLQHNNPLRGPMDHGITVALSSDILPIGPMVGLYAAVTRKGMSGEVYGADEAITMEEAIRGYTLLGAYLNREEKVKGSLEPGKWADMIVLSDDLLTIPHDQILSVQVEQTYVAGQLVFERKRDGRPDL